MVDIKWVGSPNFAAANARKVGFILHWMAGYLPGTDGMFRPGGSSDIATHYGIGTRDGRGNGLEVHQYVADKDRSYGSYNSDADTRGLSIEIENDIHLPYPGKPTPEVHELVAQFLAQKVIEHDMRINGIRQLVLGDFPDHRFYQRSIPQFGDDFNVTTHRSMALKDCPGTTDVEWIVKRGNQILNGITKSNIEKEEDLMKLRIGWFRFPGQPDTICAVNVFDHTFYKVASVEQANLINDSLGTVGIAGIQPADMLAGFREI